MTLRCWNQPTPRFMLAPPTSETPDKITWEWIKNQIFSVPPLLWIFLSPELTDENVVVANPWIKELESYQRGRWWLRTPQPTENVSSDEIVTPQRRRVADDYKPKQPATLPQYKKKRSFLYGGKHKDPLFGVRRCRYPPKHLDEEYEAWRRFCLIRPAAPTFGFVRRRCEHCKDTYRPYVCRLCKCKPDDCCVQCHAELSHDKPFERILISRPKPTKTTTCPICKAEVKMPSDNRIRTYLRYKIYGYGLTAISEQLRISRQAVWYSWGDIICTECGASLIPPEIDLLCYHLRITEGWTYKRIAVRYGLSAKQVDDRLRRIKQAYPTIPCGKGPPLRKAPRGRNLCGTQLILRKGDYVTTLLMDKETKESFEVLPCNETGYEYPTWEMVGGLLPPAETVKSNKENKKNYRRSKRKNGSYDSL